MVFKPEGLCHQGGTRVAAKLQCQGREDAVSGTCRGCCCAGHLLNAPGRAWHFLTGFPPLRGTACGTHGFNPSEWHTVGR